MVIVIEPSRFEVAPFVGDEDADAVSRVLSLIEHFSLERKRVARMQGRPSLFGDTGTLGKVSKYLNKLNASNYVVVAHGIFRILVDDSSVSVGMVFDQIMQYASYYQNNSALFARVCADLSRMYTDLPGHIVRRIATTHTELKANARGDGSKSSYMAYLEDATTRRRAIGCFVFVCHLHDRGVVSGSVLADQCGAITDIMQEALRTENGSVPPTIERQELVGAYCLCLNAMVSAKNTQRVLEHDPVGRKVRARLLGILSPFDTRRPRPEQFSSKVWYRLVTLRQALNVTAQSKTNRLKKKKARSIKVPPCRYTRTRSPPWAKGPTLA